MPSASRHRLLLFVVAAVSVAPALSRWCSPDEFRDSDGLIRLELLPEHCDWLGLGGQRLTPANLVSREEIVALDPVDALRLYDIPSRQRNFSTALARHPNLVHLGLGGNEISDAGAVGAWLQPPHVVAREMRAGATAAATLTTAPPARRHPRARAWPLRRHGARVAFAPFEFDW